MFKKTKSFLSIVCALTILFHLSCSTFADAPKKDTNMEATTAEAEQENAADFEDREYLEVDETTGEYTEEAKQIIDNDLRERGFPEEDLAEMSYESKRAFYDAPQFEYIGHLEIEVPDAHGEVVGRGQIPVNDLTLRFDLGASYYSYNGKQVLDKIKVTYNYGWKKFPFFRFEDPLGVSWDNNKFEMIPDTFYKVDKYSIYDATKNKTYYYNNSEEWGFARPSAAGVIWYADLRGYTLNHLQWLDSLWGYGSFDIGTKYIMYKNDVRSTIYGYYVHNKASTGLSLSIPFFGGFSVSGIGPTDELGSSMSIYC